MQRDQRGLPDVTGGFGNRKGDNVRQTTKQPVREDMGTKTRMRLSLTALALLMVLVLIGAACSGEDDAPSSAPAPADEQGASLSAFDAPAAVATPDAPPAPAPVGQASPGFADGEASAARGPSELGSGGVILASLQTVDISRDIIFRADLTVAVTDVGAASGEATTVVEALGGFLFGQQTTGGGNPHSTLTFKILPENFQAALTALGSIGELRSQNVSADDVTDIVVDIKSRISTAEASVTRLRAFLDDANDIVTLAELERELLNRETTLETLRGQLRTLENQVGLATIILSLTEDDIRPDLFLSVTSYLGHDDTGDSCPGDGEQTYLQDEKATVCFEIFNTGDTALTDFTLRDTVLDVELDDLIVVFGDPALLEPGQNLIFVAEITLDRDLRTRTKVTAEPVKEETGDVITGRTVSRTEASFISVEDPGGLPGFEDGLSSSWNVLQDIGGLAILGAGAILPFLWLVLLIGVYLWLRRRRSNETEATAEEDAM